MRILFYGGCHAAAFRRLFERYGVGIEKIDHLTNFRLIREGLRFPYDSLKAFDWIIFNPILNKGHYNTSHLEDYCRSNGIKFLRYPWLQWEGYYPTARRNCPEWYAGWWLEGLDRLADSSPSFDHFYAEVMEGDAFAEEAVRHIDVTTAFLRRSETNADVIISDYILQNFRKKRLFLAPDHATIELYKFLIKEIVSRIGCKIDQSFYYSTTEIQDVLRMPILPCIARGLKLEFVGGEFENKLVLGNRIFSLTEYLELHYYRNRIQTATATKRTRLRSSLPEADGGLVLNLAIGDKLLIRPAQENSSDERYERLRAMAVIRGGAHLEQSVQRELYYYPAHWQISAQAEVLAEEDERTTLEAAV